MKQIVKYIIQTISIFFQVYLVRWLYCSCLPLSGNGIWSTSVHVIGITIAGLLAMFLVIELGYIVYSALSALPKLVFSVAEVIIGNRMAIIYKVMFGVFVALAFWGNFPYSWTMWILAALCIWAVQMAKGGFEFWTLCYKHPLQAYDFMSFYEDMWKIYSENENFDKSLLKADGWSGPTSLNVPGIGNVKIFTKTRLSEPYEKMFVELMRRSRKTAPNGRRNEW